MANAGARRHHGEVIEGALAPLEKLITLEVALHLNRHIVPIGIRIGELVDADRVVNHQIHLGQWIDFCGLRPFATSAARIAARSTIAGTPVKSCINTRAG